MDEVDVTVEGWRARFPDSDLTGVELNRRLTLAQREIAGFTTSVLSREELELWEWDVLSVLWLSAPEPITMGSVGDRLLIAAGSVTHRVGVLERRGFVCRQQDVQNRRRVLLALTPAGVRKASSASRRIVEASAQAHAQFLRRQVAIPDLNVVLAAVARPLEPFVESHQEEP